MAASSRIEPYEHDVLLLSYDRTLATGNADEEAIGRSENFTCALVDYLETKCNLKVFFDCRDVDLGQSVFDARFDVFKKSKFIVPVMCPAFIQDCWSKYISESAFLDRLGSAHFIPVCVLGVTQQDTKDKMKKYRVIKCLYFEAEAVLPEDDLQALDKLRRVLTAGNSQPVQDERNNEGQGVVSNGEISQPQEESAPPRDVNSPRDDVTGGQPPPLSQRQSGRVECQQEGMKTLEPRDGACQTRAESLNGPHFEDDVRHQNGEGQPQPGVSSLGDNGLPSQESSPSPPLARVGTGRNSAVVRPAPLSQNLSEGHADAPEDRGPSLSPADWYSPVSPMPQTQSEAFQGLNREDRDCEDIGEETAEEGQGQDAVEDTSGENSVRSWMGSLSSFPRDVAPALWTCILYTENSTPQLFPAKNNAKNDHCKD